MSLNWWSRFFTRASNRLIRNKDRRAGVRLRLEQLEERLAPAAGALDPAFDTDGIVTTAIGPSSASARAVAIDGAGKIVVAGSSYNNSLNLDFTVVRYNAHGSLDTTFGGGDGIVTTDFGGSHDDARGMTIDGQGRIVVVGSSGSSFATVRYNTNGSLDTTFGGGDGMVTTAIASYAVAYDVAIDSNGWIFVAGSSRFSGSNFDFTLVRYDEDGSLATKFGGGDGILTTAVGSGNDEAYALAVANGRVVVVGASYVSGANYEFAVVRYYDNGSLDPSFGGT